MNRFLRLLQSIILFFTSNLFLTITQMPIKMLENSKEIFYWLVLKIMQFIDFANHAIKSHIWYFLAFLLALGWLWSINCKWSINWYFKLPHIGLDEECVFFIPNSHNWLKMNTSNLFLTITQMPIKMLENSKEIFYWLVLKIMQFIDFANHAIKSHIWYFLAFLLALGWLWSINCKWSINWYFKLPHIGLDEECVFFIPNSHNWLKMNIS